jgi:hypothetical protein
MCEQAPNKEKVRPTRFMAVRNTYSELFSTTIKDWLEVASDLGEFKAHSKEPPVQKLNFVLPDGTRVLSEMIFISFDRPEHVKKARGLQVTGVWLNEVKELSKPVFDILDLRHGRYPSKIQGVEPTWRGMIGDYNSPDEDHWLYQLAEVDRPEGWSFFRQPGGVLPVPGKRDAHGKQVFEINPNAENVGNLPKNYYLLGMRGKSEDWILVNLANEYGFVRDGKPVHPEYVDSVHCLPDEIEPDYNLTLIIGVDFGRTPAAALLQYQSIGRYVAFDEFVTSDFSAARFAPELKLYIAKRYPGLKLGDGWGDPSGESAGQATDDTPIKIMQAHGFSILPTITNSPIMRRSAIANPLSRNCMDGRPAFLISPRCKVLRKGLAGGFCYRRLQVSGDKYTEEPEKNEYSHIVEACEYALMGSGEGDVALGNESGWGDSINYEYANRGII